MRGIVVGILFVFSLFAAQLVRIQGFDSGSLAAEAKAQRMVNGVPLAAQRGRILTADGVELAVSYERLAISADPTLICLFKGASAEDRRTCNPAHAADAARQAGALLAPYLKKTPEATTALLTTPNTRFVLLSREITPLQWREIQALQIPGILQVRSVDEVTSSARVYPQGPATASLVGWLNQKGDPTGGLEKTMDAVLSGTPGTLTYERAADGTRIPQGEHLEKEPVNGRDVVTTIDSGIQWFASNALLKQVKAKKADGGMVLVQNVRTGELLAIATAPTFDPTAVKKGDNVWDNPAFTRVFEPGSTAKVLTIAAALSEGNVTPDTPVLTPYTLKRYDLRVTDSHAHPTERLTVTGVLGKSSNVGTTLISETMTEDTLSKRFRDFGVGSPSGVGFPSESKGIFPAVKDWSGTTRTTITYGNGLAVTGIQDVSIYQTIANGGLRVTPTLVKGSTGTNGVLVPADAPATRQVITPEVAAQLRAMLETVTSDEGTAPQARIKGYRVAGKTGTANRIGPSGRYEGKVASFIGFAPADKPELVVAVIIDNPRNGYYGGSTSGPVFHDVMKYALQSLAIPPTGTTAPKATMMAGPAKPGETLIKDGVKPKQR